MKKGSPDKIYCRFRLDPVRLERLARIFPERTAEETARATDRRLFRTAVVILAVSAALTLLLVLSGKDRKTAAAVGVCGVGAVIILIIRSDGTEKDREKRAREEMEADYPEIARQLAVLIVAGYPVRSAWSLMVVDYYEKKARGGRRRVIFEKMALSERMLREGYPEREAYLSFSDRTGLIRYMRLSGLLINGSVNGREDICDTLRQEADEAERQQLDEVKKQGEKITTQLLLPMVLLFALVMLILVVPAFLSW